ncbi:MAG: hypothetical protein NC452_20770 [Eubacterium sp.]|nr:hypothetical protein [Eubacterium sp.]
MNKQIFILNGTAGAGKDTFAELLNKHIPTKHISSITPVKEAAKALGWNGKKTDKARDFLCELKKFVNSQGDFIWDYLDKEVIDFQRSADTNILLIDIREPEEITKAVERYNAKTIKVARPREFSLSVTNSSDKNVDAYEYDYTVGNFGDINAFKKTVKHFADEYIIPQMLPLYGKVIAVDFDGTLAKTKYPEILEPINETIEFLKTAKERGAKIVLWTCREGDVLTDAVQWCNAHSVPIDYVNENVPERVKFFNNDSRKIGADLYIDDKSISCVSMPNTILEWLEKQETFIAV